MIRRQLATFLAVLAVLYAGGFVAGLLIGEDEGSAGGHSTPAPKVDGGGHD